MDKITQSYLTARDEYAKYGIDTEIALKTLRDTSLSIHCWQADDVGGFENAGEDLAGSGLQVTGNYPGKAGNMDEFRKDLETAFSLIPGNHRLSLHAIYGDFSSGFPGRENIGPKHFKSWVEWAKALNIKLDFNSTFFAHPNVKDGFTLASKDKGIRDFWIEHGKKCREISAYLGKEQESKCIHNIWIPDGSKDVTPSRFAHREFLKDSLDKMLSTPYPSKYMRDSVESKLFGIGTETFVAGSHEFYLGYAIQNKTMLTLDIGHFHPTESIADKVSSAFIYLDELLLHVTRGIRWDSDHIVALNDQLTELMNEIIWSGKLDKVNIGLDFFDATVNRIGAYVIGARNTQKALLQALLLPVKQMREYESQGKFFERLAIFEEFKTKPLGAIWDYFCMNSATPVGDSYISVIQKYEKNVLNKRR
ncbi:MAG: L-rhamnose isomerase [Bacteroidales bacterium]|nr:L-rhamnose isomerase [Bacteroidales bacterium]